MADVDDLERNKPEVSEYNKKGCLSKDEWWCVTKINEQIGVLMQEKQGYATALGQWMSDHGNVTDHIKGLRDQRYEVNQEIRAKAAGPMLQSLKETYCRT